MGVGGGAGAAAAFGADGLLTIEWIADPTDAAADTPAITVAAVTADIFVPPN